ncbi:hypothetical protein ABZ491_03845 [Micromonospora rifamycinica]|uniref:hypothetical protein n=1 Tax=Micromonospora rifamycinica TaxID=291594 RepID=UPI0033DF5BEC
MEKFTEEQLENFHKAVQTMKLYRRAEIEDDRGDNLIEQLYVDPLPNDHVLRTMLKPNTTFLIGRKGTGKSTIFQRAQLGLRRDKKYLSTYIDIKTVFESAQVDAKILQRLSETDALPPDEIRKLLLMRAFLGAVVDGIKSDMREQLRSTWLGRVREAFTGTISELFADLDEFVDDLDRADFLDIQGIRTMNVSDAATSETSRGVSTSFGVDLTSPGLDVGVEATGGSVESSQSSSEYSRVLLRIVNVKELVVRLRELLSPMNIKHLVVFIDDFSELPADAMQVVVDVLLAPLNNWSEELVKFKIAAYPGRVYYGPIDKTKIDEIYLDTFHLYGQANVAEMEAKAIDFTRRLVEKRLLHFEADFNHFADTKSGRDFWRLLFFASMGNPRTLGYLLFFLYESQLLYGRRMTVRAIRDAGKRYYEEKVEPYFGMGRFLHESFEERSSIYGLKELLELLVARARELRHYERSVQFRAVRGTPPTSHFHVPQTFDSLLRTLELNFFLTKYYVMSDRDGRRVSIYALNYGLCEKYSIAFGRPEETRESRVYFIERIFDYGPLIEGWIASNQEIRCDRCKAGYDNSQLPALRLYRMQCPACRAGTCRVINTSRKYESLLADVQQEALLPQTELGILQTLSTERRAMFAGEIAGELDVSPQLVGWRGKRLAERKLIERRTVKNRREFEATELAKRIYFSRPELGELDVSDSRADNDTP